MEWFSGSTARHLPGVNCSAAWQTVNKWELEHPGGEGSLSTPWEINNKGEVFPLASTTSLPRAPRSCRECQGLVFSQLPLKHLSSLPLFLIRVPSWVFLLSPWGAALVCDKSESTPQVASQRSEGKKNRQVPTTTTGVEEAPRPTGLKKEGPLCRKKPVWARWDAKAKGLFRNGENKLVRLNYKSVEYHFILTTKRPQICLMNCNL